MKKLLIDNVSFYKCKEIEETIEEYQNEILFILPYSPKLNPVEKVFSMFKSKIIRKIKDKIEDIIKFVITKIKNYNFDNYYKHNFGNTI